MSVFVPANVKTIGKGAFYKCAALKNVVFLNDSQLQELPEKIFSKTVIQNITLPKGLRVIGSEAFRECKELKTVQLNEGLEVLKENCFMSTGLTLVNVPESVREINDGAFWKCQSLKQLNIPQTGSLQRIGLRAFSETAVGLF